MRSDLSTRRLGPIERLLHIKAMDAAQGLPEESLVAMAMLAVEREIRKGDCLLDPKDTRVRSCFIVTSGRVNVTHDGDAAYEVGENESVGVIEILAGMKTGVGAVAVEPGLALELSSETLLGIYEDFFPVLQNALKRMSQFLLTEPERTLVEHMAPPISVLSARRMNEIDRLAMLVANFPEAAAESLVRLAAATDEVDLKSGETLWKKGDHADHLVVPIRGKVRCDVGDWSFTAEPGRRLGFLECFGESPRWFDATAVDDVSALRVRVEDLLDGMEDDFSLAHAVLATSARMFMNVVRDSPTSISAAKR